MEPIEEWMADKPIISTKKAWREEDAIAASARRVMIGAAEVQFIPPSPASNIDPTWHPEEDCFQVPMEHGDELTAVPPIPTKGTPEEQQALFAFMDMASLPERTPDRDMVTLPEHYARFPIEPIRFICENNLNFFQANITKYILRWDAKNGLEDLRKAKRYLEMFIKFVQKDPDWWRAA